jgi:signal-transduction protein with cAMP-binding, CBS, and nucleotidyltransferase domain/signal transduction histidine kinase
MMRASVAIPVVLVVVVLLAFAISAGALWFAVQSGGSVGNYMSIAFLIVAALTGGAWGLLHVKLIRPLAELTREIVTHAQLPLERPPHLPSGSMLDRMPAALERVLNALRAARNETRDLVNAATRRAEEQKSRLEAILLDLSEGVIVCNLQHRILLYNQAAERILGAHGALGLDRSLFGLVTREPVLHMLEQFGLTSDAGAANGSDGPAESEPSIEASTRRFVCAPVDLGTLLQARMSLIREPGGQASGYVLTFADVGLEMENLAARDALLREVAVEWRRPLAGLRAATEMVAEHKLLDAAERKVFLDIIIKEVESLTRHFSGVTSRYEQLATGAWPLSDIYSLDLFRALKKHVAESNAIDLTPIGVPVWLQADGHSLMLALEQLIRALAKHLDKATFDIEAQIREPYAYVHVIWEGDPIPSAVLEPWLDQPLKGTIGSRSLRQIVERHGSELWSQRFAEGRACLRLPLRPAARPRAFPRAERPPPRPEYYDFELFEVSNKALEDTPLRKLNYVVFDTETTGLRPNEGDEMVAIGAVRVVNGRILTGQTFERLINPGREIPRSTIKIHGITQEMVRDKPPARIVLPQFKSFAGDSVLVAYNAAFDMKFLEMKEQEAGVRFDNPALDAMLLAIYLQPEWQLATIRLREWSMLGPGSTDTRLIAEPMAAADSIASGATRTLARIDSFPYRHRVRELMSTPPVLAPADATLRAAIGMLLEKKVSSVFVRGADGELGIVTERDMLRAVAALGAAALDQRVAAFMHKPLQTIMADDFVYRAIGRMDRLGVRHLGVRNARGELVGAITARNLLHQRAKTAIMLGDEIDSARDMTALGIAWAKLPRMAQALLNEEVGPRSIAAVISAELCTLTRRAAELAEQSMAEGGWGPPPVAYAVLVLGSAGRGESLLAADQDNAIVFEKGTSGGPEDTWFEELGARVAETLDQVGVPLCKGGVMAKNRAWRMSLADWEKTIDGWVRRQRPQDLLNVDIFFDGLSVHGDGALGEAVWNHAYERGHRAPDFLKLLTEFTRDRAPAFTLFGGIKLDEKGRIDLKKAGLMPIFSAARVLSIRHDVRLRATPDRLREIANRDLGSKADIHAIIAAHRTILGAILGQQLSDIEEGVPLSPRISPHRLDKAGRRELRKALAKVDTAIDLVSEGRL